MQCCLGTFKVLIRGQRELQRRYSHWKDVLSGVGYVLPNEGGWQGSELCISGGIQLQPHGQRGVRVYYSRSIRRILGNCITKRIWVSFLGFWGFRVFRL